MTNQLVIPFKPTTDPPIADAIHDYISRFHPEAATEEFEFDIAHWESLRAQISSNAVHTTIVDASLKYHAQLVLMLTKFPIDIGLPITYYHAFQTSQAPLTLSNLAYERVCVLFNLAALFSQLAEAQDRDSSDGIRRASGYYQNAAGTCTYLLENGLPPFVASLTNPISSSDLSKPVIKTLELLMLAQAAECYWQKAVADNLRNGTIARLSMQVATFYKMAYSTLQSVPVVGPALPSTWLAHMLTKQHHFEAAAQIRKAMDDEENHRFGVKVARLSSARIYARQGQDSAKKGVLPAVLEDINALVAWIEDRIVEAQRDNDYIYHHTVPSISELEIIEPANLVNSAVLGGLRDPQTSLQGEDALFGKLPSWGARTAINVYNERKQNMIAKLRQLQQEFDRIPSSKLQELNLPGALELLDRPLSLPPTLLAKAAEVRADNGPMRIRQLIEDVEMLASQGKGLLNEAYDILDSEVEEDESYQKRYGSRWSRLPSHLANQELLAKAQHFSTVLEQAQDSDRKVKAMWKEWSAAIEALTSDEDSLSMLPSSANGTPRGKLSPLSSQTKSHVRILRGHLESLEELRRNRQHALLRAQSLASGDDISDRIKLAALGLERWTQVKAEMFEDVMTEELSKYDKYEADITSTTEEQEALLKKIEERNALLLQSRKDDPANKNMDTVVMNLTTAYTKYKEIVKNCKDGLTFYNDFTEHLSSLRDTCRQWTYTRRSDANSLIDQFGLLHLGERTQSPITPAEDVPPPPTLSPPGSSPETATSSPPASPSTSKSSKRDNPTPRSSQPVIMADIPAPNSSQWEPLVPIPMSSSPVVSASAGPSSKSKRQSRDSPKLPPPQSAGTSASKTIKPKRQVY